MVAYNFRSEFADAVADGHKPHTIRAPRQTRHARPGEPIQLYTGMRSKQCRKLLTPDPICVAVLPINISLNGVYLDGVRLFGEALK
ncbi:MAG: ASCH domain-containing protein, partial [Cyanobacteria bacterium J06648_11]